MHPPQRAVGYLYYQSVCESSKAFSFLSGLDSFDDEVMQGPIQMTIPKTKPSKSNISIQSVIQQQFQEIKERFGEPTQIIRLEDDPEDDSHEMPIGQGSSESGYSTQIDSSVEEVPNVMNKPPTKVSTTSNLLSMMEEPKETFNQSRSEMAGSDAVDLFIDPISIFGSERHPALVAVLQQLNETRRHRGIYNRAL